MPRPGRLGSSRQSASGPLLEVDRVVVRFGGILALAGVSFTVGRHEICGLIGPNGSGKTTLFNCISGIYRPGAGDIRFEGQSIAALPRHRMAGLGIGRTFQNLALFRSMSVRDNILVGAHHLGTLRLCRQCAAPARGAGARKPCWRAGSTTCWTCSTCTLWPARSVSTLPFGTQKRVELARALIGGPKLLLLDEPACGLNHTEVNAFADLLLRIQAHAALSILLVEHHMALVMRVSDKVVALEFGRCIAEGTAAQVQRAPEVIRAYLGEDKNVRAA